MTNEPPKISPDDPKLTAFALAELPLDERAQVEAQLQHDPKARAAVDEIRAFAAQLEGALAIEPVEVDQGVQSLLETESVEPETPPHGSAIVPGRDRTKLDGGPAWSGAPRRTQLLEFPQLYYVIGGLAAAGFALMVALREPAPPREVKVYREVLLNPPTPAVAVAEPKAEEKSTTGEPTEETTDHAAVIASATAVSRPSESPAESPSAAPELKVPALTLLDQGRAKAANFAERRVEAEIASGGADLPVRLRRKSRVVFTGIKEMTADSVAAQKAAAGYMKNGTYYYPADPKFVFSAKPMPNRGDVMPTRPGVHDFAMNGPAPFAQPAPKADLFAVPNPIDRLPRNLVDSALQKGAAATPYQKFDLLPGPTRLSADSSNTESYAFKRDNPFINASQSPVSAFAVDVDTASYANVRRFIDEGRLPPPDAVRIEELLNYFPYAYGKAGGADPKQPFLPAIEVAQAPWEPTHQLVRIGLQARQIAVAARPAANLVFLVDVSGSMNEPNKLPLVQESMRLLVSKLRPDDRVAIVTYAATAGLALPSTPVAKSGEITAALSSLQTGGSTNGAMGIQLAYDMAKANFIAGGINRVILCTDGDFNVGTTGQGDLARLVEEKAKSGVALTVLGFGMGDYKDSTLETLAMTGQGNYGYVDSLREAEKLLVQQVDRTLVAVARNVKVQVHFDPAMVASYRLIGYEDQLVPTGAIAEVPGGDLGAGDTVTALYEIVRAGGTGSVTASSRGSRDLLTLEVHYEEPNAGIPHEIKYRWADRGEKFADASSDFKFAAAVAEYGMILRNSPHRGKATMGDVIAWAAAGSVKPGEDPAGYRRDFIDLVRRTEALMQ